MKIPRCYQELDLELADMPFTFVFTTHTPPSQQELIEEGYEPEYNRVLSDFICYVTEGLLSGIQRVDNVRSVDLTSKSWLRDSDIQILCSREIGSGYLSEYLIRLDSGVGDHSQYIVLVELLAFKDFWDN